MRAASRAVNLPREVSSFVGRQAEVAEVRQLLTGSRLLTLTGMGGVTKTRSALRTAAAARRRFRDGVWLVELDRLHDQALVASAVAGSLGLLASTDRLGADRLGTDRLGADRLAPVRRRWTAARG
jgi:predicted ATPase